jgi:uncharacterized protein YegL
LESCSIPVDVALLLDVSGSMNNDNIDPPQPLTDAKEAAKSFVIRLNEADKSSLISFATFANTDRMLNFDHTKTIKEIDNLAILPKEETGSTNIGDAISHAIDELIPVSRTEDGQAFRQVIVLLTDGIANAPKSPGGEEYALSESIRAKDRGYIIYTIGLGDKVNTSFLEEVASAKEQSYKAATSKDLNRIYRQVSDSICERGPASVEIIPRSLDILR